MTDPIDQVDQLVKMFERAGRPDVTVRLQDAKALVEEVRRLRVERLATAGSVNVMLDPGMPEGTAAMVSGDQLVYLHNLRGEDLLKARRAERERCAKTAEIPIPLESWSSEKDLRRIIAERIRALPDEP